MWLVPTSVDTKKPDVMSGSCLNARQFAAATRFYLSMIGRAVFVKRLNGDTQKRLLNARHRHDDPSHVFMIARLRLRPSFYLNNRHNSEVVPRSLGRLMG